MQLSYIRKLLGFFLVFLCLGLAPYPFTSSGLVGPGTLSLAREGHEATFALPHRAAPQAVAAARDPLTPAPGGAAVAILSPPAELTLVEARRVSWRVVSATFSAAEPIHQRARSPPVF